MIAVPITVLPIMTPVQSSNVHSVGHDGAALYIRFKGAGGIPGAAYRYPTAGKEHYDQLRQADSPGRYLIDQIRHQHMGERVDEQPNG